MDAFNSYSNSDTCVVSLSGGIDSFILVTYLVEKLNKKNVYGFFLDYDQSNKEITYDCACIQLMH